MKINIEQVSVKSESNLDYDTISKITKLAFNQENESQLIDNLRNTPDYIKDLSLVADYQNELIGHVLFYPIEIIGENQKFSSLALAPMSVKPEYQKMGVGHKLVLEGMHQAKEMGFTSVIVLGHPEYYPKFGFKTASNFGIKAPFEVPDNAFMALELIDGALSNIEGTVQYPKPFSGV